MRSTRNQTHPTRLKCTEGQQHLKELIQEDLEEERRHRKLPLTKEGEPGTRKSEPDAKTLLFKVMLKSLKTFFPFGDQRLPWVHRILTHLQWRGELIHQQHQMRWYQPQQQVHQAKRCH